MRRMRIRNGYTQDRADGLLVEDDKAVAEGLRKSPGLNAPQKNVEGDGEEDQFLRWLAYCLGFEVGLQVKHSISCCLYLCCNVCTFV